MNLDDFLPIASGTDQERLRKSFEKSRKYIEALEKVANAAKDLITRCQCCDPEELFLALEELEKD